MQLVLGIANPPLAQRPLLQLTPQPLAANPPRGSTQLYTHHCMLRDTTVPVRECGLERVMGGGSRGSLCLPLQPWSQPCLHWPAVSLEEVRGVIGTHPREYVHINSRNVSPSVLFV